MKGYQRNINICNTARKVTNYLPILVTKYEEL